MPPLAPPRSLAGTRRRHLWSLAAALVLGIGPTYAAVAQSAVSHSDDATPIPRGWLRFTVANTWSRFDSRFDSSGGVRGLGDELSTDSLGPRQLPLLAPIEGALQTLTNDPRQRLTFGRLEVRSDARVVTTPFALEYGVTRRLSIGVMVPVVQTRRAAQVRVNARATGDTAKTSNVGIVPTSGRPAAASSNLALFNALTAASANLNALLTRCAQAPSGTGCDRVVGRETDAAAAARRAAEFAAAVRTAYGTTENSALVAPLAGSQLATTIDARRAALVAQLASFLPGTTLGTLSTTTTEFSYIDLQGRDRVVGLLGGDLGGGLDSIRTVNRVGIGDVELRARFLLLDHTQRDSLPVRGVQYRLAIGGIFRFATSRPDSARDLIDIGTGEGGGTEGRAALDVMRGHVGATVSARYAKSFARTVNVPLVGYPIGGFPYPAFGEVSRTAGDVFGLDVTPRLVVGEWLAIEGLYGLERIGAPTFEGAGADPCSACAVTASSVLPTATTVQRLGAGVRYSTVDSFLRGRARYPIEVSYRHLETVTGDAGGPKQFREQIQLRIFYRVRR